MFRHPSIRYIGFLDRLAYAQPELGGIRLYGSSPGVTVANLHLGWKSASWAESRSALSSNTRASTTVRKLIETHVYSDDSPICAAARMLVSSKTSSIHTSSTALTIGLFIGVPESVRLEILRRVHACRSHDA